MTASETAPPSIPRNEVAKHIARAAARLFASQGYEATSVRMIVEAAGVAKPTLYYHFGSKEGLAQALLTRPLTELLERLRAILDTSDDPRDALPAMLEAHFDFCREDPDRARFVYAIFFGPLGGAAAGEALRLGRAMATTFATVADRLAGRGGIDPARTSDFAAACRGLIVVSTVDFLYDGKPLAPDLGRRLTTQLFDGFGLGKTQEDPR